MSIPTIPPADIDIPLLDPPTDEELDEMAEYYA